MAEKNKILRKDENGELLHLRPEFKLHLKPDTAFVVARDEAVSGGPSEEEMARGGARRRPASDSYAVAAETEWSIFLSAAHGRADIVAQLVSCGKVRDGVVGEAGLSGGLQSRTNSCVLCLHFSALCQSSEKERYQLMSAARS